MMRAPHFLFCIYFTLTEKNSRSMEIYVPFKFDLIAQSVHCQLYKNRVPLLNLW